MRFTLLLGLLVACYGVIIPIDNPEHYHDFISFINKYDKKYETSDEYTTSFYRFVENTKYIKNHNFPFNLDNNEYMDLSFKQFHLFKKGYKKKNKTTSCSNFEYENLSVPDSVDWRDRNAVTPVKNQGQCGSCWSFSATGAMEGAWAVKNNELLSLSEQLLIDCSISYGDFACNGGEMESAFEFAIDNGMCTESEDPYLAKYETCEQCDTYAYFTDCVSVTPNNELHLKEAVSKGPVSVAIQADTKTFQFYSGGIISGDACGTQLDHGVLVVGYGEEDGIKYWLVKNSWGTSWGDAGYVKIERTDSENTLGTCGIAMQPSYPIAGNSYYY